MTISFIKCPQCGWERGSKRLLDYRYWFDCGACGLHVPMGLLSRYRKDKVMPQVYLTNAELMALGAAADIAIPAVNNPALEAARQKLEEAMLSQ